MSNIVVSERFKNSWLAGSKRIAATVRPLIEPSSTEERSYLFPPPADQQEPLPEEIDDIVSAIQPMLDEGAVNTGQMAVTLAAHAGALGIPPSSLYPLYYLSGMNELSIGDRSLLLQIPETAGLPLIYTNPFPISCLPVGRQSRLTALPREYLNRIFFVAYEGLTVSPQPFSSREEIGELDCIAPPYTRSDTGWLLRIQSCHMRYHSCYRIPTDSEIDAYFANIPIGTVLSFRSINVGDFLGSSISSRDLALAEYRESAPISEATVPQPGAATNVPPQDFSGERPRRQNRPQSARTGWNTTRRLVPTPVEPPPARSIFTTQSQAAAQALNQLNQGVRIDDIFADEPVSEPSTLRFTSASNAAAWHIRNQTPTPPSAPTSRPQ